MGSGSGQAGSACGTDRLAATVVLVVGGDVADALVEPDGVVVRPQPVHFEFELASL